jgi:hypothetical protein
MSDTGPEKLKNDDAASVGLGPQLTIVREHLAKEKSCSIEEITTYELLTFVNELPDPVLAAIPGMTAADVPALRKETFSKLPQISEQRSESSETAEPK